MSVTASNDEIYCYFSAIASLLDLSYELSHQADNYLAVSAPKVFIDAACRAAHMGAHQSFSRPTFQLTDKRWHSRLLCNGH